MFEGKEENGLSVFRGIPYARPPVDALRFRPPQPLIAHQGVRPATRFGFSSPQAAPTIALVSRMIGAPTSGQSEDCLFLNVWTSGLGKRKRPVLVWIHGGAFVLGSGSTPIYSGARLAWRGDAVVVTINYRLGALGYLDLRSMTGDPEAPSNLGLRDQIAALEWVRDNIEAFGGDPACVTVFGESAGAMSVGTLLGTPGAKGLFHRAILQSGAADHVSTPARAAAIAKTFCEVLGVDPGDLEALRSRSLSSILTAQRATLVRHGFAGGLLPWQPSIDGDLLSISPAESVSGGLASDVPTLIGTNLDEWQLFMLGDARGRGLDEQTLRRRLAHSLPGEDANGEAWSDRAFELYRGAGPGRFGPGPARLWSTFQSDRIFHAPAWDLLDRHAKAAAPGTGSYGYLFEWRPPLLGKRIGACHGIEIPFVFGTLQDSVLGATLGALGSSRKLSSLMQQAWLGFARSGDPRHAGLLDWEPYTAKKRAVMRLKPGARCEESPLEERRAFWEELRAQ